MSETKSTGAICGDGMCPYVPCVKYPNCNHIERILKEADENQKARSSE